MFGDLTIVAWFMGGIGLAYGWVGIATKAEAHFNDVTKSRIRRWFAPQPGDTEARPGWAESFIDLFDATFGDRFLSLKFFVRSCLATTLIFVAIVLIYIGYGWLTWGSLQEFYENAADTRWKSIQWLILIYLGNLLADYLSLIETRLVLGWIRGRGAARQAIGMLADVVFIFLIYFVVASSLYAAEQVWQENTSVLEHLNFVFGGELVGGINRWADRDTTFFFVFEYVLWSTDAWAGDRYSFGSLYADFYRISFITTYFTSAWIWLFLLAGALGRLAFAGHGALRWFGRLFDVRDHPAVTVGWFLAVITFVLHVSVFAGWHAWDAVAAPSVETAAADQG